jgi:sugar phosphate isomerase/epimerase
MVAHDQIVHAHHQKFHGESGAIGSNILAMRIGICSFSFHRLLAAGKQDVFRFITDSKELGCTQLDPWNAHLSELKSGDAALDAGKHPESSQHLSAADNDYIDRVRAAAEAAGLPFGTIAADGAHIYEQDPDKRAANRARAHRWLDVAHKLGASQVRVDAGGPDDMPSDVFAVIKEGYRELITRGRELGIEILVENHWGPTKNPDNCIKLVEEIEGLGLLYDTHNFVPERRDEGRKRCAKYARAVHLKTFEWDAQGNETTADIPKAVGYLLEAGYNGCWGVESVPRDGDEYAGAKNTISLIKKLVA